MGLKQWPESGKPFFPSVELTVNPLTAKCGRCLGSGIVVIAVENGAGESIPCPECQPLGEFELDKTNQNVLAAKKIWESVAAKHKIENDLAAALLRIGTQMANLCMKYGSGPRMTEMLDCQRMLDLDESWHETTAALIRLKSKCQPFRTQAEIEAAEAEISQLEQATEHLYESGWNDAAKAAIGCCERRALPEDKMMSLRQEARKCASTIEWLLLETAPCPYCQGNGSVLVDFEHTQTLYCQWCSATGRVKKGNPLSQDEIESREEIEAKDAEDHD